MWKTTKYRAIADCLKDDILQAKYPSKLPSNVELARHYQTTPITIRKSLKLLQESGIVKIHRTKGGTVVSEQALSRCQTSTIAFIALEAQNLITNVYFQKVFAAIQHYLEREGFWMQIENLPASPAERRKTVLRLKDLFRKGYYSGAIVTTDTCNIVEDLFGTKPMVSLLGHSNELDLPSVRHDDDALAAMVLGEVERIRAKRVAILSKPVIRRDNRVHKPSIVQVIDGLRGHGLLDDESVHFVEGFSEFEDAAAATAVQLKSAGKTDLFITYGSNISRGCYMELNMNAGQDQPPALLPVTDEDIIGPFPNILMPIQTIGETVAGLLLKSLNAQLPSGSDDRSILIKPYWRNH